MDIMFQGPLRKCLARPVVTALVFVAVFLVCPAHGQEVETTTEPATTKKLEETVVTDMLKIVDHKFDTLTTRITALERAVSNLQFFSIRQFRQVSGGLQSTEVELQAVSKKMGQLEVDGRGLKIAMSLLGRDVSELKATASKMLGEIESSMVYISNNVDKQSEFLKTVVEDTALRSTQKITSDIGQQIAEAHKKESKPVNCSVDFSSLSEHIDLRFAEFKLQTHSHFVNLINAAKVYSGETQTEDRRQSRDTKDKNSPKVIKDTGEPTKERVDTDKSADTDISDIRVDASGKANKTAHLPREVDSEFVDENDERVMQALYNMTGSVLQAVSYFRNTGRLLEQLVSNTDTLVTQQADLTKRLAVLEFTNIAGRLDTGEQEVSNAIPALDTVKEHGFHELLLEKALAGMGGCLLPSDVASNVTTILKNSSHLLEVLTDLAQMSSVSLTQATAALQDEVKQVEGIKTRMATTMLAHMSADHTKPMMELTNTTQKIFKLIEAVASNTGWLPLIFHNVQHLEGLTNHSLNTVTHNNAVLKMLEQTLLTEPETTNSESTSEDVPSTLSNRIPRVTTRDEGPQTTTYRPLEETSVLDKENLQIIYNTSLQLQRIMPALTKLLAEPDPLLTLVGGGRPDQGRVEIYHKGQWGALCHSDLTHREADIICRHLGFRGGISAGAGYFGPGAGVTWTFNATCLASDSCPIVEYSEESATCSHDMDAAVICDHMLRIIPSDASTSSKVGRLEIHHRGMWLPICGEGWSGFAARVACQQMGFPDGREMEVGEWVQGSNSTWLSKVACSGTEMRLDACHMEGWTDNCPGFAPAGVRCL